MEKKKPQRRCIGCGESRDKKDLIRVVRTPEGTYELDPTGRKNGRGAYLCRNVACMELAAKKKGFERSFHAPFPQEVVQALAEELKAIGEES